MFIYSVSITSIVKINLMYCELSLEFECDVWKLVNDELLFHHSLPVTTIMEFLLCIKYVLEIYLFGNLIIPCVK